MIKIGLICNTEAAFPLLHWLYNQNILVGVSILNKKSNFYDDINIIASQLQIQLNILDKPNLSQQLKNWQATIGADMVLVLGFPFKIPKTVFEIPKYGYFNIHFGKLPDYGGSFPVFWQIANREKEGVLTIHKMDESFDSGSIAVEILFEINQNQTFGIVENIFSVLAINGVYQLLDCLLKNNLTLKKQTNKSFNYFPKPSINHLIINWKNKNSEEIVALVKATNPWNRGAIARINNLDLKIIEVEIGETLIHSKPGEIIEINDQGLRVCCAKNSTIKIKIVYSHLGYLEGSKLGAIGLKVGDRFEDIF